MTGDVVAAIDDLVDEAWPKLRGDFKATLVPERRARHLGLLAPGETYVPDPFALIESKRLRGDLGALLNEIGRLQTGGSTDLSWRLQAAAMLAREACGLADWDYRDETVPGVLERVIALAERQVEADRKAHPPDPDIPF
jgi:hypothetical protein